MNFNDQHSEKFQGHSTSRKKVIIYPKSMRRNEYEPVKICITALFFKNNAAIYNNGNPCGNESVAYYLLSDKNLLKKTETGSREEMLQVSHMALTLDSDNKLPTALVYHVRTHSLSCYFIFNICALIYFSDSKIKFDIKIVVIGFIYAYLLNTQTLYLLGCVLNDKNPHF